MRKSIAISSVFVAGLLICSCQWPTERVLWSPDGKRAAVIGDCGLYLSDASGNLSPLLVSNAVRVAWLRDSSNVLVVVQSIATNWNDVADLLPMQTLVRITNYAAAALSFMRTNAPRRLRTDDGIPFLTQYPYGGLARLYLRPKHEKEFIAHLGDVATNYPASADFYELRSYVLSNGLATCSKTLAGSEREILYVAASPDDSACAYTVADWDPRSGIVEPACLYTGFMSGRSRPDLMNDASSVTFTWATRGNKLVFVRGTKSATRSWSECVMSLGALTMMPAHVEQLNGDPLIRNEADRVLVAFDPSMRIVSLPDYEVLYTAPVIELPRPVRDDNSTQLPIGLFRTHTSATHRVLSKEVETSIGDLRMLGCSPDGKFFAVACKTGGLSIVAMRTGNVLASLRVDDRCPENNEIWTPRTIPTWRSADELCFAVEAGSPMGSSDRAEIVLWSLSNRTSRCLSANWPSNAVSGFLSP